jgi:probable DNA metabolism protein
MELAKKLGILSEAAKYDVSCSSSGSRRTHGSGRLGNTAPGGICHSYTEDGRCVSLLKILFTNYCIYDCAYCVNRSSNDIPRAAFAPDEVVALTIDFYRRNYIEGLFLSSGVWKSPDDTMVRLVRVVGKLRAQGFNGYIHLKCIPHASAGLIRDAGLFADRLSVNIELPSEESLRRLAAEKTFRSVMDPMRVIREKILETRADRRRFKHTPLFAPAGQSTQLVVGASPETDYDILHLANRMYREQALKRVYYSGFVPTSPADPRLTAASRPPLVRENRLYQADWLLRHYGYSIDDIVQSDAPQLDRGQDPKLSYAQRNPQLFPVDINAADLETILKVPGIGLFSARRIVQMRRSGRIRYEHLRQMGVALKRARPYILCPGLPTAKAESSSRRGSWGAIENQRRAPHTAAESSAALKTLVLETDGSFQGLLTAIFTAYTLKSEPVTIRPRNGAQGGLFDRPVIIRSDSETSGRVWHGLKKRLGHRRRQQIFHAYLSGVAGIETLIYRHVRQSMPRSRAAETHRDPGLEIEIENLGRKVQREAHRMKGFVRFEKINADVFLALISPRYDVLPLIREHFQKRYADQNWIIYDTERQYGIFSDSCRAAVDRTGNAGPPLPAKTPAAGDWRCRLLWKRYFESVNIAERSNPKLHLRQLPRRYWKYLPEKCESTSPCG